MKLRPDETELRGGWQRAGGSAVADAKTKRIEELTRFHLHEVARDESGWDVLYQDPQDGRYWELVYPASEAHGGGAPLLRCVSSEAAALKYDL